MSEYVDATDPRASGPEYYRQQPIPAPPTRRGRLPWAVAGLFFVTTVGFAVAYAGASGDRDSVRTALKQTRVADRQTEDGLRQDLAAARSDVATAVAAKDAAGSRLQKVFVDEIIDLELNGIRLLSVGSHTTGSISQILRAYGASAEDFRAVSAGVTNAVGVPPAVIAANAAAAGNMSSAFDAAIACFENVSVLASDPCSGEASNTVREAGMVGAALRDLVPYGSRTLAEISALVDRATA